MKSKKQRSQGEEFAKYFYTFDIDEYENKEVQRVVADLKEENKRLKKELKVSHKKINTALNLDNSHKNYLYADVYERIEKDYDFLSPPNITTLATAEYFYLNETERIDYTGIYISYVKVFELELEKALKKPRYKTTLGRLMCDLKNRREFKTFIEALERMNVVKVRNKAVHRSPISKGECGKLRQLLLEDRWLDRICYLLEEADSSPMDYVEERIFVEDYEGRERVDNQTYNCYLTDQDYYLLTKKNIKRGYLRVWGDVINCSGINYLIF